MSKQETVNGIPVISIQEVIKPVLQRFNCQYGDSALQEMILDEITQAINKNAIDELRRYFSEDDAYWLTNLQHAYFRSNASNSHPLANYEQWANTKSSLMLSVLKLTKEDDLSIQLLLNFEDFANEVFMFSKGVDFIIKVYELRGLDFFLFQPMGGIDAHADGVLFSFAENIVTALNKKGRLKEAERVKDEIEKRKQRLEEISLEYQGINYDPNNTPLENLNLTGEKFWSEYLGAESWLEIEPESRNELTDAFVTEILLEKGVYTSWSTVALALCKVIERELGNALFQPYIKHFHKDGWNVPIKEQKPTKTKLKQIESRKFTFNTLCSCVEKNTQPTLGQLVFLLRYFNDEIMDECTHTFRDIRAKALAVQPEFLKLVKQLSTALEKPLLQNQSFTLIDARNSSAHPSNDSSITWDDYVKKIREMLGAPPITLIKTITKVKQIAVDS